MYMNETAGKVKAAALKLAATSTEMRNLSLKRIASALLKRKDEILEANRQDLVRSEKDNIAAPLLKRLKFDNAKIADAIEGINSLAGLEDPIGKTLLATELDDGLELFKISCPIGVIGIIFESRPDALVQISTLCLKSGNGVLLKGGSEALETNRILTDIISKAAEDSGIPSNWVKLLETRSDVSEMLKMDDYIDLIIPRGSNDFVKYIMNNSNIPVMGHADGICHCYIDSDADLDMALNVVLDSKTQYVAVCNALETLLVHSAAAPLFLPALKDIFDARQVELTGCERTRAIIMVKPATEVDWSTEYLDYKLSVKIVDCIDEAIDHINAYGSGHTDSIITSSGEKAAKFMSLVDSGNVMWNCSTRFSDGYRYGFGAEVGISTGKLHARGPVGLEGLVIYKYKLIGNGQIVADYTNRSKTFKHRKMNKEFPL